ARRACRRISPGRAGPVLGARRLWPPRLQRPGGLHEAQLALLESLAPRWDEDWWFLTYLGWARIELGDLATGTEEAEQALDLNPQNAYAAHARAHGFYEAGDAAGGAGFVAGWLPRYDRRSQLHGHLSW